MQSFQPWIFSSLIALLVFACGDKGEASDKIESAKIVFRTTLGTGTETKVLTIAEYGKLVKIEKETEFDPRIFRKFGIEGTMKQKTLEIYKNDSLYAMNLSTLQGSRQKGSYLPGSSVNEMGIKKGEEKILNKNCEIFEREGSRYWIWKGIALKQQVLNSTEAVMTEEAISIEENYKAKPGEFSIPVNVRFVN